MSLWPLVGMWVSWAGWMMKAITAGPAAVLVVFVLGGLLCSFITVCYVLGWLVSLPVRLLFMASRHQRQRHPGIKAAAGGAIFGASLGRRHGAHGPARGVGAVSPRAWAARQRQRARASAAQTQHTIKRLDLGRRSVGAFFGSALKPVFAPNGTPAWILAGASWLGDRRQAGRSWGYKHLDATRAATTTWLDDTGAFLGEVLDPARTAGTPITAGAVDLRRDDAKRAKDKRKADWQKRVDDGAKRLRSSQWYQTRYPPKPEVKPKPAPRRKAKPKPAPTPRSNEIVLVPAEGDRIGHAHRKGTIRTFCGRRVRDDGALATSLACRPCAKMVMELGQG